MPDVNVSRGELYALVWAEPVSRLAKRYGLTDYAFRQLCIRLSIPIPRQGYWNKLRAGDRPERPSLPSTYRGDATVRLTAVPGSGSRTPSEHPAAPTRPKPVPEEPLITAARAQLKLLKDIKGALETDHGRPFSDQEVEKVADFLKMMAEMQVEIFLEDQERQARLTESPGGFQLEKKGYSCRICHGAASGKDSWFDEHGLKCESCQEAINQQAIPPSVATDPDSWYSAYELESNFGLTAPIRRKWIKKGFLIAREIPGSGKRAALQLFLISDNATMLPPKKFVQGHMVKEIIDGQEFYCSRPWYWFGDPNEHLKGYKIMEYLHFVPVGQVDGRSADI